MKKAILIIFSFLFLYGLAQTNINGNLLSGNGDLLSASGEYVEIADDSSLNFNDTESFSVQFWLRPKNLATTGVIRQGIVTKKSKTGKGYGIFWDVTASTNKFIFQVNDGSNLTLQTPDIANINSLGWINISAVMQRDANGLNDSVWLYLDGEVVDKAETNTIDDISIGQNVYLMRYAADAGQTTAGGYLDEVRIWNVALTPRQVRRTYNEPIYEGGLGLVHTTITNRFTTLLWSNLVMYHNMEDLVTGFEIFDKSDNANDGQFFEGPSGTACASVGCGPKLILPPLGEKPPTYVCSSTGNWSAAATWEGNQVPVNGDKTTIYVKDGAVLTVDLIGTPKCREINVDEGGTLVSDVGSVLQITKYFDVDGAYKTNDGGSILFDEVGDHTIDGSGVGSIDFFNLELYQNSQLQVLVPINIYGVLVHEDGRIRTGDQITIKSNKSNAQHPYGLIAKSSVGNPDVVGLIKMELELSNSNAGWRQMSFPFSGDFNSFNGLTLNLSGAPAEQHNVFYWDYVASGITPANNAGWTSPSATSTESRAYSIYLDDNTFSFSNPITFEGDYNPGDKVYPLTYLNDPGNGIASGQSGYENGVGWNFIPNLYPSLLDASEMTLDNTLAYKNIHIWDANTQQYMAFTENVGATIFPYNNSGTGSAELSTGGVMPFQGFWVKTTNATETSFTLKNDWRGVSFSNINPQQSLKTNHGFQVDIFSELDSTWDGALVVFDESSSKEFKTDEDVYKLVSYENVPSLYFETSKVFASIYKTPNVASAHKLNYKPQPDNSEGLHHIHISQVHLNNVSSVILEDLLLNEFHDLKQSDYSFLATANFEQRFVIHYFPNKKVVQEMLKPEIKTFGNGSGIVVKFENVSSMQADVLILNSLGQVLYKQKNVSTKEDFVYPVNDGQPKTYIVRVVTSDLNVSSKLIR